MVQKYIEGMSNQDDVITWSIANAFAKALRKRNGYEWLEKSWDLQKLKVWLQNIMEHGSLS